MIVIFLYLFDYSFPLIALIYTNTPRFRVHPCSSVVGIISHRGTSFRGCISDHWTSLNLTEPRMYISCFRVYLCPSVGILISLRKRNLGAKVQQKMHICKKIARKFTFRCDFLANGLHWATVLSRRDPHAGGAIEGTTVSLNARVQPAHSRFSRESLLSGAIYCDFWLFLYKNTLRFACYKNIQK
jgi:hypothetical protein